jgi:hypothetical protein
MNGTGLGEVMGLHKFIDVSRTSSYNEHFKFTGFTTQSLIVNMGLLSSVFGIICLQLIAVLLMNSVAIWLNDRNKFAIVSSTLTRVLKP